MSKSLVLGLNALYHDSGVVTIDLAGKRVFALAAERITRYKHDGIAPIQAIESLIRAQGIEATQVEHVMIAMALTSQGADRIDGGPYATMLAWREFLGARFLGDVIRAEAHFRSRPLLARIARLWGTGSGRSYLRHRVAGWFRRGTVLEVMMRGVGRCFPNARVEAKTWDHHLAHAWSGLVLAGAPDALYLTLDGWGDGYFSKAFVKDGEVLHEVSASPSVPVGGTAAWRRVAAEIPPHILASGIFGELTLGHFYSIVTWLLGFAPVSDEGKVEALAAYGTAENPLLDAMRKTVRLVSDPPRLEVDREAACALFLDLPRLRRFVAELGREQVAAATQRFLEEQVIALVRALLTRYPRSTLVLSGGCAANVVLNMRLFEEVCPDLYVVPAMADDGTALGAAALALSEGGAALADFGFLGPRTLPYFGDAVPRSEVLRVLTAASARIRFEDRSADWPEEVADRLMRGEIGALFHGRMEWGPRALGHRSIVANPCRDDARDRLNAVVKRRPLFQPFCPAILAEERDRLFAAAYDDRHMTCAFRMREEFHAQLPGAIHVDGTARAQFVHAEDDPEFHRMLTAFRRSSGFGVVINTSFNLHGRTIVRTAEDALDDFLDSRMEFLVIEGYLVLPIDQRSRAA